MFERSIDMTQRARIIHQDHRRDGDSAEDIKRNHPPRSRYICSRKHIRNRRRDRFRGSDETSLRWPRYYSSTENAATLRIQPIYLPSLTRCDESFRLSYWKAALLF